jgi:hypothetical protein
MGETLGAAALPSQKVRQFAAWLAVFGPSRRPCIVEPSGQIQPSHAYLTGRANTRYAGVTTNRKSPLVWMAAPIVDPYFRPQWLLNFSNIRAHFGVRSGALKTWNEIMRCLRSRLQCVSRLRSLHCHQARSKRERHLPFAARFAGNIGPRINSPDTTPTEGSIPWTCTKGFLQPTLSTTSQRQSYLRELLQPLTRRFDLSSAQKARFSSVLSQTAETRSAAARHQAWLCLRSLGSNWTWNSM